jgi:multidrug efflux pump
LLSPTQLQDVANNRLASKISEVPGVGLVSPSGGNVPAVRVEADPHKLAGYGVNIDDLRTLLANINVSQPKGNFDGPDLDYTINDNDQIQDPKDYLNTVIAAQETQLADQQSALSVQQNRLIDAVYLIGDLGGGWSQAQLHDPLHPNKRTPANATP